ncbi:MAG: hypothetical protein M9894_05240 [Planctomycetes bacterium]|nr:hypothetical protein [Planctomycetota bacterium]
MTDPGVLALASGYVAPDGLTFWGWDEGGQVLSWAASGASGGATIAFAPEVALALARLAPQGLPSFQAVVLLLGACREGWLEAADASFARVIAALEVTGEGGSPLVPRLARALEALTAVTRLPAALRAGPDARATLVEVVLEGAPARVDPDLAPAVAKALEWGAVPAERGDALTPRVEALARDLEAVTAGLERRTSAELAALLEARRRTGLDAPPRPAPVEVEEPPALRVGRLLDALQADPELGPLARLARDLRAAVHVPRAVSQADDLPLGGVSDITNRGPLDRLLVSELAHDDETFVVRVATGEALFLRREAPPRAPEGGRALLVDAGVRLWGVGRVFATAVALAAAAGAGRRAVQAFTARRGALAPLDLTTREGLLAHLEALDPAPHPGAALAAFAERAGDGERLLVTHEDALDDLRPALEQAARSAPLLVATVARDGTYRLRAVTARGAKPLSQARLDLRGLLEPPRPAAPPLAGEARAPAIFALRPLPLRLPAAFDPARAVAHPEHGVVAATGDGRLLWFQAPLGATGGVELTDQLPAGPLVWLEVDDEGRVGALVGPCAGEVTLLRASLDAPGEPARLARAPCPSPPLAVVRQGPALLLVHPRHVDVLALATGAPAPGLELPAGLSWRMGRFFTDDRGWLALGADGLRPALEPLSGYPRRALALWDRRAREGPWAVEADGSLLSGAPVARIERLGEGDTSYAGVGAVSSDGERLLLYTVAGDAMTLEVHEVEAGTRRPALPAGPRLDPRSLVEPALGRALEGAPQVRTRLGGLAVGGRGELVLVSRRRRLHALELGFDGSLRLRSLHPGEARLSAWRSFQAREPYAGAGWSLAVAAWTDGSRAFLDGRGLLHLVPARGVEVTLALAEGPLAAWTSQGELVGPRYFTGVPGGDVPRAAAEAVLEHVARFCEGIG